MYSYIYEAAELSGVGGALLKARELQVAERVSHTEDHKSVFKCKRTGSVYELHLG